MEKLTGRLAVVALLAALAAPPSGTALAADAPSAGPAAIVLVIDPDRVRADSKAGKAIQSQLQQRYNEYQQALKKQDGDLLAAQQELQRQQAILAPEAFATRAKEFDQKVAEARKWAQETKGQIDQAQLDALKKLDAAMIEVVAGVTKERGANLVLTSAAAMIFETKFEVTDEAIKRLDEKLPSVAVNFAAPGAAPTAAKTPKPETNPKKPKGG